MEFNSNGSKCPCKGCTDRTTGEREKDCHTYCERYNAWKAETDSVNEVIRKDNSRFSTMSDAKKKAIWRSKRYNRQGGKISSRIHDS